MSDTNSIRNRFADFGFTDVIADHIADVAREHASRPVHANVIGNPPGVEALLSFANHVRSLPREDPCVYVLFLHGANDAGNVYSPSPTAAAVLEIVDGPIAAEALLKELAIASLEDRLDEARADAHQARAAIADEATSADVLRAQIESELAPQRIRAEEAEAELARVSAELVDARGLVEYAAGVRAEWERQIADVPALRDAAEAEHLRAVALRDRVAELEAELAEAVRAKPRAKATA